MQNSGKNNLQVFSSNGLGRRQRGAVLAEFSIALLFVIPLLVGAISYCNLVNERSVLANAVRLAARTVARLDGTGVTPESYQIQVVDTAREIINRCLSDADLESDAYRFSLRVQPISTGRLMLEVALRRDSSSALQFRQGCVGSRFVVEAPFVMSGFIDGDFDAQSCFS
ncbi:MAG: hypothetical protein GX589_01830 [Deltaproteobacteria bacterium]|nr:hypothetical protein [Deltaproteobacteria bacterium]